MEKTIRTAAVLRCHSVISSLTSTLFNLPDEMNAVMKKHIVTDAAQTAF